MARISGNGRFRSGDGPLMFLETKKQVVKHMEIKKDISREKNAAACKKYYEKNRHKILKKRRQRDTAFVTWLNMVNRCLVNRIPIQKEWRVSFDVFIKDLGARPSNRHFLRLNDWDKGYVIGNCVWGNKRYLVAKKQAA